ncbi:MAG: aminotransferase class III-fold pyridoxal phosphate-dependent enzyme, partial [Halofilum sp. (in: g-proteobacteria)]|nr:aminotransferase class III-fold pyridoxal phosphate-dependent enzyme [Halofilum sp. (in: g-proteobacteria)]
AFWLDGAITREVERKGPTVRDCFQRIADAHPSLQASVRGRGFMWGLDCGRAGAAEEIAAECFRHGLVIETAGVDDRVLKFLAPLTIDAEDLAHGLGIIEAAADKVASEDRRDAA